MKERERDEKGREGGLYLETSFHEGMVLLCSYGEEEVDDSYHEQHP